MSLYLPFKYHSLPNPLSSAEHLLKSYQLPNNLSNFISPYIPFSSTDPPKSGSFVEYASSDVPGSTPHTGIVVKDLRYYLTSNQLYHILTPQGTIDKVAPNQIIFHLPNFIRPQSLTNPSLPSFSTLSYILNVFNSFTFKLTNELVRRDLPRTAFLQLAQTQKQGSANLTDLVRIFRGSKGIQSIIDPHSNLLGLPALHHSTHSLFINDPIHFRFIPFETSLNGDIQSYIINPLNLRTTTNFINPIHLASQLLSIYTMDSQELLDKYGNLLNSDDRYRCFILLSDDPLFRNLIRFIKYTIEYPHIKMLAKLDTLSLPLEGGRVTPRSLYRFLISLGVYGEATNPILSSEIYGQIPQSREPEMVCARLDELKPFRKIKPLVIYGKEAARRDDKRKKEAAKRNEERSEEISETVGQSVEGDAVDQEDRRGSINLREEMGKAAQLLNEQAEEASTTAPEPDRSIPSSSSSTFPSPPPGPVVRSPIYQLSKSVAFSLQKLTLTKYLFNFFLPIPTESLSTWMVSNPINFSQLAEESLINMPNQLPRHTNFRTTEHKMRPCFRISFVFDYLNSESLTDPDVEVKLDVFKHSQILEDSLFQGQLNGSKKNVAKMLTLDKLQNLLRQKEQARLQEGLLNVDTDDDLQINLGTRQSVVRDTKLLLDEYLSMYCDHHDIAIIHRSLETEGVESADSRKSRRFKIFKWYANSYDTFRQSGKMDVTNLVSCLKYIKQVKVGLEQGESMKPLGLTSYGCFTNWDYLESYVNNLQLLNHVRGQTYLNMRMLMPKMMSNSNAFLELRDRLRRYEGLRRIGRESMGLLRCIIVDPAVKVSIDEEESCRNAKGYCLDLDMMVDVEEVGDAMVGDRLICELSEVDCVGGKVVVR